MDADDLLEQWLAAGQDLLKARKGSQREQQLEERIAGLEARFEKEPAAEKREALGELDDDEIALLEEYRAGKLTPPPPDEGIDDGKEPPKVRRTRPGRKSGALYEYVTDDEGRIQKVDIPTVYSGADEPDEVEIPDDDEQAA